MKKLILLAWSLFAMSFGFAQNAHITFMGVEVNGTQSTVEQRLTKKGFSKTKDDLYKGTFSGYDVKLKLSKTVKSKVIYSITVMFGDKVTREELAELSTSLNEKYGSENAFNNSENDQVGIDLPEGTILMDFGQKTLSYIDKANSQKNRQESKEDL